MNALNATHWIVGLLTFAATAALVLGVFTLTQRTKAGRRLDALMSTGTQTANGAGTQEKDSWVRSVAKVASPFAKLSVPSDDWQTSQLRRRFMRAGLRHESAPMIFFGLKTVLALVFPLGVYLLVRASGSSFHGPKLMYTLIALLAIGYYLPNYYLRRLTERRQREIFENFPDALDLLTICIEAGSSLEAGIERVAREIRLKSEVLSDELELVVLEMRAGAGKERALRNLAMRTGVDDVDTLVATLVQSDRFGTSVGQALRVHSDMLRTKRQQRAEEAAAKVALKLLFPLVVFIFPAILLVVGGPPMIRILKQLPKMFS
jgi:tight adherence protein C